MADAVNQPTVNDESRSARRRFLTGIGSRFTLAGLNHALFVAAAAALILLVLTTFTEGAKLGKVRHAVFLSKASSNAGAAVNTPVALPDPFAGISGAKVTRNVFQPAPMEAVSATANRGPKRLLKIVGIAETPDPLNTTVMIENTLTGTTYFLRFGEEVEGMELEQLSEDKVVIKIGGDSVEVE